MHSMLEKQMFGTGIACFTQYYFGKPFEGPALCFFSLLRSFRRRGTCLLLNLPAMRATLLLLLPEDFEIETFPVVLHRELRVVVYWNGDGLCTIEFVVGIVELHHVGVAQ